MNKKYYAALYCIVSMLSCFAMDEDEYQRKAKRKRDEKMHQKNVENSEKVGSILYSIKKNRRQELIVSSPEAMVLSNALSETQCTPGDTKGAIATNIIQSMVGHIDGTPVTKNNKLIDFYESDSKPAKLIGQASKYVQSPDISNYVAVNVRHVMHPEVSYDDDSVVGISGGHSYKQYRDLGLIVDEDNTFVSQDNNTLGVLVGNSIAKTMLPTTTENEIIDRAQTGITLAKDPCNKNAKISQAQDGSYFCTFKRSENSLLHGTQFPILVVDGGKSNSDNKIYVGKFKKNAQSNEWNFSTSPKASKIDEEIYISPSNFKNMMLAGKPWNSLIDGIHIVDITDPLSKHCTKILKEVGLSKFPGSVFGLLDDRRLMDNNVTNASVELNSSLKPTLSSGSLPLSLSGSSLSSLEFTPVKSFKKK